MSTFLVELILLFVFLVLVVPALLIGIWRSLRKQKRYRAARGMVRWVGILWVIAIVAALIAIGALSGPGYWSEFDVWMAILALGVTATPTLITVYVLSIQDFHGEPK